MALATVTLGGELDIASGEELGKVHDSLLGAIHKGEPEPLFRPLSFSGQGVTSAAVLINTQQTPAAGKKWFVTHYAMGVNDDHTAAGGVSAAIYAGDPLNPSLLQCKVPGITSIPTANFLGEKRFQVIPTEYLFVIFYGTTNGQQLWVTMTVAEYNVPRVEKMKI